MVDLYGNDEQHILTVATREILALERIFTGNGIHYKVIFRSDKLKSTYVSEASFRSAKKEMELLEKKPIVQVRNVQ